jgi:hypothetical protein
MEYEELYDATWSKDRNPAPNEIEGMEVDSKYSTHDIKGGREIAKSLAEDGLNINEALETKKFGEPMGLYFEVNDSWASVYVNEGAEKLARENSLEEILQLFLEDRQMGIDFYSE